MTAEIVVIVSANHREINDFKETGLLQNGIIC